MKSLLVGFLVVLGFAQSSFAQDQPPKLVGELEETLKILSGRGFSGSVLVEEKGNVLLRKAYGKADRKKGTLNTPEMRFDTGSVTKPIVAAAILVQVKNGALKLDDKLGDLLKGVPADKQGITVEQLLSHTSGIDETYNFLKVDTAKRDAVVASLLKIKLASAPGSAHLYSNANYFLLAAILDTVDKRGNEQTIKETVFQPLKMNTAVFAIDKLPKDEVSPFRYVGESSKGKMTPWFHTWGHKGATGIVCSVDDLAAFTKALHTNALFNAQERQEWLTLRKETAALGWEVLENPGSPKVVIHSGTSIGSRALLAWYPEHDITVAVLMNTVEPGNLDDWTVLATVREYLQMQMKK